MGSIFLLESRRLVVVAWKLVHDLGAPSIHRIFYNNMTAPSYMTPFLYAPPRNVTACI